ncbi:hypothetical protein Vadar_019839 [Vaccinium darrowii]|uniref:Uncharacterized protein n=1 Tax=Vaccinium darrowii TaxID=229202 RepID=A0ACB7ZF07_9ERIC|nr:hypothetical protein Vadar_019839 [Vaccinium darrowii]
MANGTEGSINDLCQKNRVRVLVLFELLDKVVESSDGRISYSQDRQVVRVDDAKRAIVGAGARILFYPTLLYNAFRSRIQAEFRWWDEIDQPFEESAQEGIVSKWEMADIIKVSEEEAQRVAGITQRRVEGLKVDALDTTGAGDAFVGGILAQLAKDDTWLEGIDSQGERCNSGFVN